MEANLLDAVDAKRADELGRIVAELFANDEFFTSLAYLREHYPGVTDSALIRRALRVLIAQNARGNL
jgi:hypothetical protein